MSGFSYTADFLVKENKIPAFSYDENEDLFGKSDVVVMFYLSTQLSSSRISVIKTGLCWTLTF